MKILMLFLFCATVNSVPIKKDIHDEIDTTKRSKAKSENEAYTTNTNITKSNLNDESRVGIIDEINPFNNISLQQSQTNKDTNGKSSNNPLAPLQNLFSNASQLFNGSNPFGQLFPSQPGGNFLDNIKIFLVGTQGVVMPASSILGGFQNLMQGLGSVGNFMQVPTLPSLPLG